MEQNILNYILLLNSCILFCIIYFLYQQFNYQKLQLKTSNTILEEISTYFNGNNNYKDYDYEDKPDENYDYEDEPDEDYEDESDEDDYEDERNMLKNYSDNRFDSHNDFLDNSYQYLKTFKDGKELTDFLNKSKSKEDLDEFYQDLYNYYTQDDMSIKPSPDDLRDYFKELGRNNKEFKL